jgi:drug/metabolite transporter (DMT)-like permease
LNPRAWSALWTVYVIWGSTYLGIALAGETIPPVFAAALRFTLVGLLLAAWVLLRRRTAPFRAGRAAMGSAVLTGLLLIGANALLFVAERDVPIGLASLIIASVPLWIVLLRAATGDRPPGVALAGTLAGFAGVALLLRPEGEVEVGGLLLVVGSAAMWALGTFLSTRLPLPADAITTTAVQTFAGGVLLLPLGVALRDGESLSPADWSTRSRLGLVYLIGFGSIVGLTAFVWLLAHVPIGTVATYAYVNPVVAITLGVLVLHEDVSWPMLAGAAIVLASVAVVIRRESEAAIEPFPE